VLFVLFVLFRLKISKAPCAKTPAVYRGLSPFWASVSMRVTRAG
jgi:hypothetical protein